MKLQTEVDDLNRKLRAEVTSSGDRDAREKQRDDEISDVTKELQQRSEELLEERENLKSNKLLFQQLLDTQTSDHQRALEELGAEVSRLEEELRHQGDDVATTRRLLSEAERSVEEEKKTKKEIEMRIERFVVAADLGGGGGR